jgi:Protein of unknown function (DUF1569)
MKSLFDERLHGDLLARVNRIAGDTRPKWGKMNAAQMLTHLVEAMKLATGELTAPAKKVPFRHAPLRQLVVYWLPWPKGAPTSPALMPAESATLERSKSELARLLSDIASRRTQKEWPQHPAFGPLSRRGWGVLTLRHLEHHLKQFGV